MSYHSTNLHTDDQTPVSHDQWTRNDGSLVKVLKLGELANDVTIFLTAKTAAAIHAALKQLYPELAEGGAVMIHGDEGQPPMAVLDALADSGAATAPLDDVQAALDELASGYNAPRFGCCNDQR